MQKINKAFCIILILGPALFFGYNGKPVEMGLALLAGSIAACFINLDKFSSFKGGGFEAQLREARDTVDKAMVTVENLRNIMSPIVLSTIHNITYTGRWGGPPDEVNEEILRGSLEIAKGLNLSTPELKKAISTYYQYETRDEYSKMVSVLKEEDCCKQKFTEIKEALSNNYDHQNGKFPPISIIEILLKENGVLWEDISQNGKDALDHYSEKLKQFMESIT